MKKKLSVKIILLTVLFALTLCACGGGANVKARFERAGYHREDFPQFTQIVCNMLRVSSEAEMKDTCSMYYYTTGSGKYAVILEFTSASKLRRTVKYNDTLLNLVGDVDDSELVNGKYLLYSYGGDEALEIFCR